MASGTWACKDCTDRYVGCHDHCSRYLEQKKARDEIKAEKEPEKRALNGIRDWRSKMYSQYIKDKRRKFR